MVHGWPLLSAALTACELLWGSVCHHVEREARRFITSIRSRSGWRPRPGSPCRRRPVTVPAVRRVRPGRREIRSRRPSTPPRSAGDRSRHDGPARTDRHEHPGPSLPFRGTGEPLPSPPLRVPWPDAYTARHLAEQILISKAALEGERKQVTVLFADLKGSLELLVDRDPEEARRLLDPVLQHMIDAVHRYEGTVNQIMGDGIMALFGAPLAHEDHAVRACYAALRMQESVKRYAEGVQRKYGVMVRIRVGL